MPSAKVPSYLLILNGSHEAKLAAQFAWGLSASSQANVVAQQVIDVPAIWHFLRFTLPGLVGSGVYFEAETKIAETLRAVAETVSLSYMAEAEGHGLEFATLIDEGDTADEICRRAQEHDLLIIGRLDADELGPHNKASSRIVEQCSKPIVFVNAQAGSEHITISFANRELNPEII